MSNTDPIYMVMCGGAPRTTDNPYGVRWHNKPEWFTDELGFLSDHDRHVVFHQPGGFPEATDLREAQQGARLAINSEASLFSLEIVIPSLTLQGIKVGVYWSCELPTSDGAFVSLTHQENSWVQFKKFVSEWEWCRKNGITEIWRDRGAHPTNYPAMIHLAQHALHVGIAEGVEAFPYDRTTGAARLYPNIPCLCLDQFLTARWDLASKWYIPKGYTAHALLHNKAGTPRALTPEQIAILRLNGWTIGETSVFRKNP